MHYTNTIRSKKKCIRKTEFSVPSKGLGALRHSLSHVCSKLTIVTPPRTCDDSCKTNGGSISPFSLHLPKAGSSPTNQEPCFSDLTYQISSTVSHHFRSKISFNMPLFFASYNWLSRILRSLLKRTQLTLLL